MGSSGSTYDVVIIGAGVSGAASALWCSRLDLSVCVVEAADDVCCGTSKANSAIVHAGFDAQAGTLMARLNVEGNALMYELAPKLGFKVDRIGSLVVCTDPATRDGLERLLERGHANGVPDLRIVEREELVRMEPNVSDAAVAALWAPTAGIVDPFGLNLAMATNAALNGTRFVFNARVTSVEPSGQADHPWLVHTLAGDFMARCVVNAAGVYADQIHNMVSAQKISITPRKGEYLLLDTTAGQHVRHTVFALPTAMGKGVLVTPTVHGNLLVGPTATDIPNKEGTNTTAQGLSEVARKCAVTVKDVPLREVITSFAGLRAHQPGHEFIIGQVADAPGFVDCAGIESPGLTASPAIGRMVAGIVQEVLHAAPKPSDQVVQTNEPVPHVADLGFDEWTRLIRKDPAYGRVVCRCRRVTEGEIVASLHGPIPARSLDGVKRRTTACMGRCQAGFCSPKIMRIMEREIAGMDAMDVTKAGPGSEFVVGTPKDRPCGAGDEATGDGARSGSSEACDGGNEKGGERNA
ncbi:MAG: NAD(P)/FAD-dependent oxidoreductase [Atopobiaceae bacterium]